MDYKKSAADILTYIGGEKNVVNLEHCSTRLRFTVADQTLVDEANLKKVPGVIGVILNVQVQIVIGNAVIEVYNELMKLCKPQEQQSIKTEKQSFGNTLLSFIVGIFQPLVPAIAGAGVLKSILILLSTLGIVSASDGFYVILSSISDATFYFLPLMVAVTTATKMNTNKLVALAAVGVLLLPNNVALLAEGFKIFGITVKNVAYNSQVFPAILTVLCLGVLEKGLNKISPKAIRVFFVPMVALAITIPLAFLVLGPLGYTLGEYLTSAILFLYDKLGFLGIALLSGILPFMIATGMHKAMVPYAVSTYGNLGYEMMYLPASLAHNISESGACFAVAIKAKDQQKKSVAASAGISALMGITEPALYGVTLLNKKVLISVIVSGFITGGFCGFVLLKSFVIAGPGLANITMFIDPKNGMNFIYGVIGFVMAFILSFVITFFLWKEEANSETPENNDEINTIQAPLKGNVIALESVNDEMFSKKALGDGIAMIPEIGELYAPCEGIIKMVFDTKHAIGMETTNGTELLFHVGLNTVELNGKYYEACVKAGDHVKQGDLLLKFDVEKIKSEGYDVTTPIIVTNTAAYDIFVKGKGQMDPSGIMMMTERKK